MSRGLRLTTILLAVGLWASWAEAHQPKGRGPIQPASCGTQVLERAFQ